MGFCLAIKKSGCNKRGGGGGVIRWGSTVRVKIQCNVDLIPMHVSKMST